MFQKMAKDAFDEDHAAKNRGRKAVTPTDTDKKRGPPRKISPDELLRKRLWTLYKTVFDYAVSVTRRECRSFACLPGAPVYGPVPKAHGPVPNGRSQPFF